jgi:hypothetical protein
MVGTMFRVEKGSRVKIVGDDVRVRYATKGIDNAGDVDVSGIDFLNVQTPIDNAGKLKGRRLTIRQDRSSDGGDV